MNLKILYANKADRISKTKIGAILLALVPVLSAVGEGLINGFGTTELTTTIESFGALLIVLGIRDAIGK